MANPNARPEPTDAAMAAAAFLTPSTLRSTRTTHAPDAGGDLLPVRLDFPPFNELPLGGRHIVDAAQLVRSSHDFDGVEVQQPRIFGAADVVTGGEHAEALDQNHVRRIARRPGMAGDGGAEACDELVRLLARGRLKPERERIAVHDLVVGERPGGGDLLAVLRADERHGDRGIVEAHDLQPLARRQQPAQRRAERVDERAGIRGA
ncbi:MAG: hypothetical protein NTW87_34325, partial [Planctomycetota bacterium]|nr:hypothetical protein [Planctomycetota bacterium]